MLLPLVVNYLFIREVDVVRLRQLMLNNLDELKIFFKFSVVGVTGAIVDLGLLSILYTRLNVALTLAVAIAFIAAVVNNYTWNILWTYSHQDHSEQHHVTMSKFVLVSVVGLAINEVIVNLLTGVLGAWLWLIAKLVAMGIVLIYKSSSVPNLAQGSMTMLGAYVVLAFVYFGVFAPMGLEIGALAPEEIAISIVAELIAIRRNAESAAHKKLHYEPRPALTER